MSWMVLENVTHTARQPHRCNDCMRVIDIGEKYRRVRAITDDGPTVYKVCGHCDAVADYIWRYDRDLDPHEGIDLGTYLADVERGALLFAYRRKWAGVDLDDVAAACDRSLKLRGVEG